MIKYLPYSGEINHVKHPENYLNFKWREPGSNVIFSVTRQGNGATSHFTSDRRSLRKMQQALNEWCEFCFWLFDWCEMVIAKIDKPSIRRLAEQCGFEHVVSQGNKSLYIRRSKWAE
jgi:hypothetical protein